MPRNLASFIIIQNQANYFNSSLQVEANIHAGVYDLYLQNTIVLGTKASA